MKYPNRLRIRIALVGLALAAGAGLAAHLPRDDARAAEEPESRANAALPVELIEVQSIPHYVVGSLYAGRVVGRRTSELGFERAGRLVEVATDQGRRVEAGALLARLDTQELRARRREVEARRQAIAANLALARTTSARRGRLFAAGHLASQNLDESRYAQASLEAEEAAAIAALEVIDVQLGLSELRAPFSGVLEARYVDEGTVVQSGTAVFRLLEDRVLEVHVGVPPAAATPLTPGSLHAIAVEGARVEATVSAVLPTVDAETRTVTVVFELTDPPPVVRPGALARVEIEQKIAARGFWLPLAALAEGRRGLWSAYVAMPRGGGGFEVERRQVEVLYAEADRAYVSGTLAGGDRVVAGGVHRLVPGARVRPVSDAG